MVACPKCSHANPAGSRICAVCTSALEEATLLATQFATADESATLISGPRADGVQLAMGAVVGERYEILEMLGEGGMGAVYKARDRELDRLVALKLIRPELANNPVVIDRFKQELILARQVTHKNVIRLFDLGVAGGIKFITMEFIVGRTLSDAAAEGKMPPEQSTRIIQQACRALEAAHGEGVIHRDLKPQNIMLDENGKASVMDFGLAYAPTEAGSLRGSALAGTPAYMSPEQASRGEIDHRSDIYSLGVIYYELLTGKSPFQADSVMESLRRRAEEIPRPVMETDPTIPKAMSDIVQKCMAVDPAARYQTAAELLHDLDVVTGDYKPVSAFWKWTAAGAGVLLIAVVLGGVFFGDLIFKPPAAKKTMTVLLADFKNTTGETVFDRTLEPMFKVAIEGAGFVNAFDRTQLRSLGVAATDKLDEATAVKIAVAQGLGTIVSGTLDRRGNGYLLSVKAIQPVTGKPIATAEATASNRNEVLSALTKVAGDVRKDLGDDTSGTAQRFAMETITAGSLEAVHEYAMGMNALSNGKFDEALQNLSKAVELDPKFGLAYAVMASAARNLGRPQEAEKYIKMAIANIDRMTERERYRTRGFYYLLKSDLPKCVEEYGALISRYSSDVAAHNNLAYCAADLRNLSKAVQETRQATEILPKRSLYRGNLAIYLAFSGDFQTAEKEARAALQIDPASAPAAIGLAYAQAGQGQLGAAAGTFRSLENSKAFASIATLGEADIALYEGRFSEAASLLEKSAEAEVAAKNPGRAADKFIALAHARVLQNQNGKAAAAAERALQLSKSPKISFLAARIFAESGQTAKAKKIAYDLGLELETEPQVYGKLLDGEIALKSGDPRVAVKVITEANKQLDTWIGRFDLGRAYLAAGAFLQADAEFDRCIKRRGEALSLFLNEVPSYSYFPQVYYYLGRVREGLGSAGFAESYRAYLAIREKAGEDPLLAEVRRRAGK